MPLATKCPYCGTVFRVASDQLKLRGGIVRCGCCQQVFDGNAGLQGPAKALPPAAPADLGRMPAAPLPHAFAPLNTEHPDAPPMHADPDFDLDLDLDFDLDAEPAPAQLAPAAKPAPEQHWIDLDALTAADDARLQREAMLAAVVPTPAQPKEIAAAPATEPDDSAEPAFVVQGRRNQRHGKTVGMLMGLGSCALLLALLAQGVLTFGSQLAAWAPSLKPTLTTLCSALGCRIALPMQIKSLSIELGELQTLSASTFSYATVLHNNGPSVQAWPNIELILTDGADKALLRRVFAPRDYLGRTQGQQQNISAGFAARSEQAVKLYFELAQINASGYHIAVFYP